MGELGKVLYEMHVQNARAAQLGGFGTDMKIKDWNSLDQLARDAWNKTAADFGEWLRS